MRKKGKTAQIIPTRPKDLVKIFQKLGLKVIGQKGSHIKMFKEGMLRDVIISNHANKPLHPNMIKSNIKTAGITQQEYLDAYNSL